MFISAPAPAYRWRPALWFGALALLLVLTEHWVVHQPVFSQRPALRWGVLADVLMVLPLLCYWLVLRPYRFSPTLLVGVGSACLALAGWLLPAAQQPALRELRYLPALLEAATLGLLALRARRLVRAYRAAYAQEPRHWPSTQAALRTLGPAGTLLLAELHLLRYAGLGWWATPEVGAGAVPFSSYRESGFVALVATAGVVMTIETGCVHLLARHWYPALAPWLLLLDGYGLALLLGHAQAVRLRPTQLGPAELVVRVGLLWEVAVPRALLVAAAPLREAPAARADLLSLTRLLFTAPNIMLTFAEPVVVAGPYGRRRAARCLAIYLDQPQQFLAAVGQPTHP